MCIIHFLVQGTNDPYAFVEFADHYTAAQALQAMNKRVLLDKVMLGIGWLYILRY